LCHSAEDVDYEYNDFLYKDYDKLDDNMVDYMSKGKINKLII